MAKKRNGSGCGCGGMCGNPGCGPKRRRNPAHERLDFDYYTGTEPVFKSGLRASPLHKPVDLRWTLYDRGEEVNSKLIGWYPNHQAAVKAARMHLAENKDLFGAKEVKGWFNGKAIAPLKPARTANQRNPPAPEHAKRGAYQYGRAEKLLKKGDTYGAAALAHIAESNFLDGNDLEGVQFAHDLAKQAERASRAVRNPVKNYGPKRRRNPVRNARPADWPVEKPATLTQMLKFAQRLQAAGVPFKEAHKLSRMHPKSEWESVMFWAEREYGSKKRNPAVHAASEDYKLGLFQGAAERGMQPPPKETSHDLRRGYADGAKVAKAMPSARSEALGVYKATGNQLRAADVLYDNAKGGASTVRNPRAANSPATATAYVSKIRSIAHQAGISDRDAHWALHYPEAAQSKHPAQAKIGKLFLQAKEKGLGNAVMAKFEKRIGLLANPRKRRNPPADMHAFRGKQSLRVGQDSLDSAKKSGSSEDYLRAYAYGVSARGDAIDGRDDATLKKASALMQAADASLRQDKAKKSNPRKRKTHRGK